MNHNLQKWRSQEAQSLDGASAFTELIKPLFTCLGLPEARQLDFIEMIDTPDMPPNDRYILEGDLFILLQDIETLSAFAKGRRCRSV
jgi:hypothetical protein